MEKIKDIEYYLRLNLLNIEGVTPFLQSIVLKIASLTYGNSIEGVLTLFKKELEKVVGKESFKLLFPIDGTPSNVSKWDITLTSSVLLNCFTLERKLDQLRRILEKDMELTGNTDDLSAYRKAKESDLFAAQGQQITTTQYKELSDAETVEELGADLIICMVLLCGSEKGKDSLYDICKNILFQEIELDFNNRTSVNSYLNNKKRKIEDLKNDLTIFDAAFKRMYPDNGPSDYTTWNKNILVLFVLKTCERLNRTSQVELKKIRNIRNQMSAHKGKAELTFREFLPIWTDLFGAIKSLLREEGMDVNEFEERVKYFKDGDLDVQSSIDMLRKHYMEESNEYLVLKTSFGDIEERIVETMKTYQRKVRNLLESTNSKIRDFGSSIDSFVKKRSVVVYTHEMEIPCVDVNIVVKGNDKTAVAKAHNAIIEAIKDPTSVERKKKKAIRKILEIIERDGSTVIEVRKGSVIASVKCRDLEGVSSLFIYVGSEDWADTINELTTDIGQELKSNFTIETNITEESIQMLTDDIHQKDIQYEEIPPLTFGPVSTNEVSNKPYNLPNTMATAQRDTKSKSNKLVVAAIDFGTTHTGYAYSFNQDYEKDPLKIAVPFWCAGSRWLVSVKTPTNILINPDKTFRAFGYDAEDEYSKLAKDGEQKDYYYFRRFKMLFEKSKTSAALRDVQIEDDNGKKMKALEVFGMSITYFKGHLMDFLSKSEKSIDETDIKWVLTVPAIWSDELKQFMRDAAEMTGIKKGNLIIVLEPEAASLYCMHEQILRSHGSTKRDSSTTCSFPQGTKYMVVDAGGCKVDMTVLEVVDDRTLKVHNWASGGACGGSRVDAAFETFIRKIVGDRVYKEFQDTSPADVIEVYREFERKKRNIENDKTYKICLNIPLALGEAYRAINGQEIKDMLVKNPTYNVKVTWVAEKLEVKAELLRELFKDSCDSTVRHMKDLFSEPASRGTDTILLVGGFSESTVLQEAIDKVFPKKRLIIPEEAGLAVLQGAVLFGHSIANI